MHANYLSAMFEKPKRLRSIAKAIELLSGVDFQCIAVRGVSGLGIGAILAHVLNKDLIVVRKSKRGSNSGLRIESPDELIKSYIIIDDLIDSGNTCRKIISAVKKEHKDAKLLGGYFYYEGQFRQEDELRERINYGRVE